MGSAGTCAGGEAAAWVTRAPAGTVSPRPSRVPIPQRSRDPSAVVPRDAVGGGRRCGRPSGMRRTLVRDGVEPDGASGPNPGREGLSTAGAPSHEES